MKLAVQIYGLVALQTTLASLIMWRQFVQADNFIFEHYHVHCIYLVMFFYSCHFHVVMWMTGTRNCSVCSFFSSIVMYSFLHVVLQ